MGGGERVGVVGGERVGVVGVILERYSLSK